MTCLLLDIGNSRVKAALDEGGRMAHVHVGDSTPDGLAPWLDACRFAAQQPAQVWVSSVAAAAVNDALGRWARGNGLPAPRFVRTQAQQCGVRCAYADPSRLGVDRWMVVLAAAETRRNTLVVDAGTACTVDAVTADGRHLGGLILPGVQLTRQTLNQRTQFSADDVATDPLPVLGDDTNPAVTLGAVHALLGAIGRVEGGLGWAADCDRLLTGGEAHVLRPHLDATWDHRPNLVLEGLRRVASQGDPQLL